MFVYSKTCISLYACRWPLHVAVSESRHWWNFARLPSKDPTRRLNLGSSRHDALGGWHI